MLLLCVQFCVGLVQPVQVQLCVKRMLSEGARTFLEGTDTRFRARAGRPGRQRVATRRKLFTIQASTVPKYLGILFFFKGYCIT